MSSSGNIAQQLFTSPDAPTSSPQSSDSERVQNYDQALNLIKLEQDIEQSLKCAQKEMHHKRIQALRKELDYLNSTNWQFDTSDNQPH